MIIKVSLIYFIFYLITGATGQCRIRYPQDASLKPSFYKLIGTHIAKVSNVLPWIDMQANEVLTAQCDTKFIKPNPTESSSVTINCYNGQIQGYYSSEVFFECDSEKWNLYESTKSFRWCSQPFSVSYVIARPSKEGFEYLAGVCYDIFQMSVVSLHYAYESFMYPQRLQQYQPSVEIKNIRNSFVSRNVSTILYDNEQFQQWIQFGNFQNHSLIQNSQMYHNTYQQFGGLLEFIWWTGLRLGNWRQYEEALANHLDIYGYDYDILSGISGFVSAPVYKKDSCKQNYTMTPLVDRTNRKIPLYVWQYLRSRANDSDSLVVIGVNSPFQEFYQGDDLLFCNDICHQIEWLQTTYKTFRYQTLGTIFCCTVAEVQASNRFNGFPLPAKPLKTTPKRIAWIIDSSSGMDEHEERSMNDNSIEVDETY